MKNKKTKICFITGSGPQFVGGVSLYQQNLIDYVKNEDLDVQITWIYKSDKNEIVNEKNIKYIGLKCKTPIFIDDILFNRKVRRYLKNNYFDIINSHAVWGYWMSNYKKQKNQRVIHTYHGATYPYYKVHLQRFNLIKKIFLSPMLLYGYLIEKPPTKHADKIISVSNRVKEEINKTYKGRKDLIVIRTGVKLKDFKYRNKKKMRKELQLNENNIYGLHLSKAGYWIKGLDRVVKISKEIYKLNKNYRLIVVGADYKKNKQFLNEKFIIYRENVSREKIPYYYNASDIFFCLSRYEGGAPTLVVSEAMASGCMLVCSKDSKQEIIKDNKNGIIIEFFDKNDSTKAITILNNKNIKNKIIEESINTVKELSLDKWGKKYLDILLK